VHVDREDKVAEATVLLDDMLGKVACLQTIWTFQARTRHTVRVYGGGFLTPIFRYPTLEVAKGLAADGLDRSREGFVSVVGGQAY